MRRVRPPANPEPDGCRLHSASCAAWLCLLSVLSPQGAASQATAITFEPPKSFALAGQPFSVAIADLTGDHIGDLVVSPASNSLAVLLATGGGNSAAPVY